MTRYEIKDTHNPGWRGMRFTSRERAERTLDQSVGEPGRWALYDRTHKKVVRTK